MQTYSSNRQSELDFFEECVAHCFDRFLTSRQTQQMLRIRAAAACSERQGQEQTRRTVCRVHSSRSIQKNSFRLLPNSRATLPQCASLVHSLTERVQESSTYIVSFSLTSFVIHCCDFQVPKPDAAGLHKDKSALFALHQSPI